MSAAGRGIAITGMAGRFPGAPGVAALWRLLREGREGLARLDAADLARQGVPRAVLADPRYVPAAAVLDGVDRFDAAFWGVSPHEAALMDPQQRILLETAWHALEDAGLDPRRAGLTIGVFVGAAISTYLLFRLHGRISGPSAPSQLLAMAGNDKDYAATQLAYRLDLKGPALAVQTACSTSLVAVHVACQSLLSGECDAAIAGGVSVRVPHRVGYLHEPGGMLSPDGRCRSFAEDAGGTVFGSGCGLVVLRRLEDAGRDRVRAVVLGSAVNNDGARKVGFAAPGQHGQAAVVAEALAVAGVSPSEVGHVEGHGTGTRLGDPIEVAALAEAFGGAPWGSCLLGSAKSNLGHLETAAGVAGLIKTALMLERGEVAPTLHADRPSSRIPWEETPFRLAREALPWTERRIGGVSSFGIGGTNAHAVLGPPPAPRRRAARLATARLVVSAQDPTALADLALAYRERLVAGADPAELAAAAARRPRLAWWLEAGSAAELAGATARQGPVPDAAAAATDGPPADLPHYPFRRVRHWVADHAPLLGPPIPTPSGESLRQADPAALPWLREHKLAGEPILPGAFHLALLAEAGVAAVRDIAFVAPLPLDGPATVQFWRGRGGTMRVAAERDGRWLTLCEAAESAPAAPAEPWTVPDGEEVQGAAWGERMAAAGLDFGPAFRRIARLRRSGPLVEATLSDDDDGAPPHRVAVLDAGLQALGGAVAGDAQGFRPAAIGRFAVHGNLEGCRLVRARLTGDGAETKTGDALWLDADGAILAEARGVACRRAGAAPADSMLHALAWRPSLDPALAGPHEALERIARGFARIGLAAAQHPARPEIAALLRRHAAEDAEPEPAAACAALAARHGGHAAEIALVARCGERLPDVLAGRADPLDVLFGDGAPEGAYAGSPLARALNAVAASVAAGVRPRRVLEVGGGTGATTEALRGALPPGAEYLFTDIGAGFIAAAARRFADWPGFRAARLDIGADPVAQGAVPGAFDLVVAANALHAAPDLRAAIAHAALLLAPGGRLLLVEGTGPLARLDLTFGLTEGWSHRTDRALRPEHPLLPVERWRALLAEAGLADAAVAAELGGQAVLVAAREPGWLAVGRVPGAAAALGLPFHPLGAPLPSGRLAGVVALAGLEEGKGALPDLLALSSALAARTDAPRLLVPTAGAEAVAPGERPDPAGAALGGFVRTLARERPELRPRTVDLPAPGDAAALAAERVLDDGEDRTAWRNRARLLARLAPPPPELPFPAALTPALRLEPAPPPPAAPGPGQVRVRVRAAGLNFKDVLTASGALPPAPLGGEAAGEVESVGTGVSGVEPGDSVVVVAGGALASHALVDARLALPKPPNLPFPEAAAVPIAGTTAWVALHRCARVAPGQRVLVHQATGGVGWFALRLAQEAGATVVATAGSERKRTRLRALGAAEVRDSRRPDLDGLAPVDAVVGALAPGLRRAALRLLKPGGHWVEIGRTGAADADEAAALRPDLRFHRVALDAVDAAGFADPLREVLAAVAADPSLLPPVATMPLAAAEQAFGAMRRAEHIGKLVLLPEGPMRAPAGATWLVTGGLGGLGPLVAGWLRARGAGGVLLLARRGPADRADVVLGDVADPAALAAVDARAAALGLPRVRGVVHAAGVLEDALVGKLDPAAFARVAAPKLSGLAAILARWPGLDLLIGFSSAGGQLGSAGQAAHTAASAALDAALLAARARGVPAVAVDWGAWTDAGAAAARGVDLAALGAGGITPERGFAALDAVLARGLAHAVALPLDLGKLRAVPGLPPLLRDAVAEPARDAEAPPAPAAAPAPPEAEMPAAGRRAWLRERVAEACAGLLSGSDRPDANRPLADFGLDSLGALELRNRLGRLVGAVLPASLLFSHPTVSALAEHLATTHFGLPSDRAAGQPAAAPAVDGPDLAGESEEDLDAALARFAALHAEDAR